MCVDGTVGRPCCRPGLCARAFYELHTGIWLWELPSPLAYFDSFECRVQFAEPRSFARASRTRLPTSSIHHLLDALDAVATGSRLHNRLAAHADACAASPARGHRAPRLGQDKISFALRGGRSHAKISNFASGGASRRFYPYSERLQLHRPAAPSASDIAHRHHRQLFDVSAASPPR